MFIHFAFGTLGKQDKTEEQTDKVIELILKEKRLKASKCTEFIPVFPDPNSKPIPLKPFRKVEGRNDLVVASIGTDNPPSNNPVHYLPEDVPMISFIKTAFNQLKHSKHSEEYGKYGIVFTKGFLNSNGIRPVRYYTEESLFSDPLILRWENDVKQNKLSANETQMLKREITSYGKPATLFNSFMYSVSHIIHFNRAEGTTTGFFTYDRYPAGYDFRNESEYRIIFDDIQYLCFNESDLFMVITPDLEGKERVKLFLKQNWSKQPKIEVFPS
jgi:hypothetical protein